MDEPLLDSSKLNFRRIFFPQMVIGIFVSLGEDSSSGILGLRAQAEICIGFGGPISC